MCGKPPDAPKALYKQVDNDFQTTNPKVFAAGDCRRGQSLVVWAIREGRDAATAIDRFLNDESAMSRLAAGVLADKAVGGRDAAPGSGAHPERGPSLVRGAPREDFSEKWSAGVIFFREGLGQVRRTGSRTNSVEYRPPFQHLSDANLESALAVGPTVVPRRRSSVVVVVRTIGATSVNASSAGALLAGNMSTTGASSAGAP